MFRTQFEIFEIIIGASESIENRVSTKEDEILNFGVTQFYNVSLGLLVYVSIAVLNV